jgi:hypothetical protein
MDLNIDRGYYKATGQPIPKSLEVENFKIPGEKKNIILAPQYILKTMKKNVQNKTSVYYCKSMLMEDIMV